MTKTLLTRIYFLSYLNYLVKRTLKSPNSIWFLHILIMTQRITLHFPFNRSRISHILYLPNLLHQSTIITTQINQIQISTLTVNKILIDYLSPRLFMNKLLLLINCLLNLWSLIKITCNHFVISETVALRLSLTTTNMILLLFFKRTALLLFWTYLLLSWL